MFLLPKIYFAYEICFMLHPSDKDDTPHLRSIIGLLMRRYNKCELKSIYYRLLKRS